MSTDNVSDELLLRFALVDVTEILGAALGDPDARAAYGQYRDELEAAILLLDDRAFAEQINNLPPTTEKSVLQALAEEKQSHDDREAAEHFDQHGTLPHTESQPTCVAECDDGQPSRLQQVVGILAEPLRRRQLESAPVECGSCFESFPSVDTFTAQCGDVFCRVCLIRIVRNATHSEEFFPPRCHKTPFQVDDIANLVPRNIYHAFQEKALEWSTPNRTYCSNMECSTFIKPEFISGNEARCPDCLSKTCADCKAASHGDDICRENPDVALLLALAETEQWQQCFECRNMVSISQGCNHMTCRCKAQWCYECGEQWKTCTCATVSEPRLYDEATRNVNLQRQEALNAANAANAEGAEAVNEVDIEAVEAVHAANIEAEAQRIRAHHECQHDGGFDFAYIRGATCQMCNWKPRIFAMSCVRCNVMLCRRCQQNQL